MSDEGEKICPLCAEGMDMTDQQLKPCKCGYEICVWCWHHIMDMSEKDDTEGRCPACRTPYNKEKIVANTASFGGLVSEMNMEKKARSSKFKNKSLEARKQLASVRVIQKNLVYVVGLPLSFADEDLLQRREYFSQYGKVLKVSISRTASGAIQKISNCTCSVYITYLKEEDAVRCIQSVHGFLLDGKSLRACFGTTKYCHAWLRSMSCSNSDCLYLHEIGSQVDSFTKDETVSAYTRVQQITGSSCSAQRRSGNMLPPPVDEYCNNTFTFSEKPITKTAVNTNDFPIVSKVSPPNSSSGRSSALPARASWGARASCQIDTNVNCFSEPFKKQGVCDAPLACCTTAVNQNQLSVLHCRSGKMSPRNEESTNSQDESKAEASESLGKEFKTDERITSSGKSFGSAHAANMPVHRNLHSPSITKQPPKSSNIFYSSKCSVRLASEKDSSSNDSMHNICSDIFAMSIHENQNLKNGYVENLKTVTSQDSGITANTGEGVGFNVQSDHRLGIPSEVTRSVLDDSEEDLVSFNSQKLKDPEVSTNRTLDYSHTYHQIGYPEFGEPVASISSHLNIQALDKTSYAPTGHPENMHKPNEGYNTDFFPSKKKMLPQKFEGDTVESSIISDIFSVDFYPWDETLTSPQNMAKLLGEDDKGGSFAVSGSRKGQSRNQSRFSFAREEETEETMNPASGFGESVDYFGKGINKSSSRDEPSNHNNFRHEQLGGQNGFLNGMESKIFTGIHSHVTSNRVSDKTENTAILKQKNGLQTASRSQISAPPGFRSPPPGFFPHDRTDHVLDAVSGNRLFDASSVLRHNYPIPSSSGNTVNNGDIEFMDPAILAVGKGTVAARINGSVLDWRSYSSTYEEAGFQSYLHNQRFSDIMELANAYQVPSNNISPFYRYNSLSQSNGQWDAWK